MIIINNLSKSVTDNVLFQNLSLTVNHGDRLAIIGQNGCGKSTLLRIIAGDEAPDEGSVQIVGEQVAVMPQQLNASLGTTVADYLVLHDAPDAWRYLSDLGLIDLPMETNVESLSGGQKTKLLLIRAFSSPSTVLLLDEPTNHLDSETKVWLMQRIRFYDGAIIMISHDRTFLNACATQMLEIDATNNRVALYQGNYDAYVAQKEQWMQKQAEAQRLQQRKKHDMLEWLVLKRQEASVHPNPAKGRQIRQMERRLDREILSQEIAKPRDAKTMAQKDFSGSIHSGKLIARMTGVQCVVGDRQVIADASFELRGRTHVRLVGENGAGKSTLIRVLVGETTPSGGVVEIGSAVRVGYFAQQLETLHAERSVLATLLQEPDIHMMESRARAVLGAFLFSGDAIFKNVSQLSHGERVRSQLLLLLQKECELLVLDEPTNHLDIDSREVLEDALQAYGGALLVVSHDEYFLKKIGIDEMWEIIDGSLYRKNV